MTRASRSGEARLSEPWVCAVLIRARDMEKEVQFYREVCGFPLEGEGGPDELHYGCELGDVHFAIHPAGKKNAAGEGGYRVAFAVEDVDAFMARLKKAGTKIELEPTEAGFGRLACFRDPEDNVVEVTTLSASWLRHLRDLRGKRGVIPVL
jgi:predicted enzyme related to lactoylglutathione lyase